MSSVSQRILSWIVDYIGTNNLVIGDVLPSECEICERLEVGRSSVREAFAALKAFGVAQSKQRVGLVLISDPRRLGLMRLFAHDDFEFSDYTKIRELRSLIELGAAAKMLKNAKSKDVANLQGLIDQVSGNKLPGLSPVEFEVSFHEYLAGLIDSEIVQSLTLLYRPLFEYHAANILSKSASTKMPSRVIRNHQNAVDALKSKDLDALIQFFQQQLESKTS